MDVSTCTGNALAPVGYWKSVYVDGPLPDASAYHKAEPLWKTQVIEALKQEGLVEFKLSVAGVLESSREERPGAVFLGMGLCTNKQVSVALPIEALGMLLIAERTRGVIGARSTVLLIADEHARSNSGLSSDEIDRIAGVNEDALRRAAAAFGLSCVKIVRASDFHARPEYLAVLAEVDSRAPDFEHAYFHKEVADIEFLDRICGGVLKVGWTISSSVSMARRHDEVAFDQRFRSWMGNHVPFIYCKAGRVLDERRPKASPYVTTEESKRLCLRREEEVHAKLTAAEGVVPPPILKGVRKHLSALTRTFGTVIEPLSGRVEDRAQQIIGRVFGPATS